MRAVGAGFVFVLFLCCLATGLNESVQAQVACGQVGNHLVKVAPVQGSTQLVDCETPRLSKQGKHKITWQASGSDTLTIAFPPNQSPFLNFACVNQKQCTAGQIDPKALGDFKYTVTLKSGGKTYTEDPKVIIEQ